SAAPWQGRYPVLELEVKNRQGVRLPNVPRPMGSSVHRSARVVGSSRWAVSGVELVLLGEHCYSNHTVHTRELHAYLRWRNANARHPDVLAAQRKERARIRSEKGIRWGGRPLADAA